MEGVLAGLAAVAAFAGAVVATDRQDELLGAVSVLGLAGVLAWWLAARRYARRVGFGEDSVLRHEQELVETRAQLNDELRRERELRERLEQCRRLENEWEHELRRQVMEAHREMGAFGDPHDLRALILRVAIELVGAEKGMLLTRDDGDGDGNLDLAAQVGFKDDPSKSAVAQRFARDVIERDRIVKEDDVQAPGVGNLIAIPIYMHDRFSGVVVAANRAGGFGDLDDDVLLALGDQAGAVLQNAHLTGELRDAYLATVSMLADALEAKDPFLRTHGDDASRYVGAVAGRLGFDTKRREQLVFASLLHDVGKLGITERILLKPADLTSEERSVIELHPRIGFRIVEQVPSLNNIAGAVLHHHERWDGAGYPSGLKGEEIPVEARLVSIADAFSAMTSDRPYRERRGTEDALAELERCAGTQFDSKLVALFVEEVRNDPPREEGKAALARALSDPELQVRRRGEEPLLGYGTLARMDNLTLLYSHRHCRETIDAETARAEIQGNPFAVIAVEVSDIARINSERGYAAGDEALRTVADAVQAAAADCGGTACRYSGSRMLLIAPHLAERAADRVREEIASVLADGPSVRCAHVVWRRGDSGDDVLSRLEIELAATPQRALAQ